jgi:hypothetical protein
LIKIIAKAIDGAVSKRRITSIDNEQGQPEMNKVTRYAVRYWPTPTAYSRVVGSKCRLVERSSALRIVRRLKRRGIDAFSAPVKINI